MTLSRNVLYRVHNLGIKKKFNNCMKKICLAWSKPEATADLALPPQTVRPDSDVLVVCCALVDRVVN